MPLPPIWHIAKPEAETIHFINGATKAHYQKILCEHGFKVSMSGKGNCYASAAVETFFKTIKAEQIWRRTWQTRREAKTAFALVALP